VLLAVRLALVATDFLDFIAYLGIPAETLINA
jgi:hypothetical protein